MQFSGHHVPKRKIVFFFRKEHSIAGSLVFFLSLARCISERDGYEVYYLNYPNKRLEEMYGGERVVFCDVDNCDYSQFEDAEFILPVNYLFFLLEKLNGRKCKSILLYGWHPDLPQYFVNQFLSKRCNSKELFGLFKDTASLVFMDKSCRLPAEKYLGDTFSGEYIPVFPANPKKLFHKTLFAKKERFSVGWMSRLDSDKIYALLNLLNNLKDIEIDVPIDIHIIGDGDQRHLIDVSNYSSKGIRFIFTGYLYGSERDTYLKKNVDLMVAMGISALDSAQLEIPVILPSISSQPFADNRYVYLFDTVDYSLGWNIADFETMKVVSYSLQEIIDKTLADSENALGKENADFVKENFCCEKSCDLILKASETCELTVEKCFANKQIDNQWRLYKLYKRIRTNRDYESYLMLIRKLNGILVQTKSKRIFLIIKLIMDSILGKLFAVFRRAFYILTGTSKNK